MRLLFEGQKWMRFRLFFCEGGSAIRQKELNGQETKEDQRNIPQGPEATTWTPARSPISRRHP